MLFLINEKILNSIMLYTNFEREKNRCYNLFSSLPLSLIYFQSSNISNAIYESNWMDQSEAIKRTLLIVLMRAQKPLSLTIGPFRTMNMEAGLMVNYKITDLENFTCK